MGERENKAICAHGYGNMIWVWLCSGCKSQEKRGKSHKYDSKGNRFKKKSKEGSVLRRPRTSSQHATRGSHSDDDEDEGVPASYHTVSLQVSQDVSMAFTSSPLPASDSGNLGRARDSQSEKKSLCFPTQVLGPHLHSVPLSRSTCKSLLNF